jgi:hypothetical protein
MTDERAGIKERYTRAMGASRLIVSERPGDVDLLIAAGWVQEGLATSLYRLMAEYDTARGDRRVAEGEQRRLSNVRADALQEADRLANKRIEPEREAALRQLAQTSGQEAEHAAIQARAFMLLQLKTLNSTKQAVFRYADQAATRRGLVSVTPQDVARIVGAVLGALLDPLCPGCQGSGKVGTYPNQHLHTGKGTCGGSGRRKVEFAKDAVGDLFGRWLVADLERKAARVDQLMRKFLSQYRAAEPTFRAESAEAVSELRQRLVELRSAEAAVD